MNIIVCVKKIPDPEIPPGKFNLDSESRKVIPPEGIPPVINPYDEQAVEVALRLKDKYKCNITTITIDNEGDPSIIKHTLAMGADEGIVLSDKEFIGSDSFSTAYILSQAIKKTGDFELVLFGRQAADWDEGLVGSIVAENLGLPLVTLAKEVNMANGEFRVKRVTLEGYQEFAVPSPAVVTISHEAGRPRLPSGWGIISASRKQVPVWGAGDIDINTDQIGAKTARRKLERLFLPERSRKCAIIEGESPVEASVKLAEKLTKTGVI